MLSIFCCLLLLVLVECDHRYTFGPARQTQYLISLPPNTDEILFNMQTRKFLEIIQLSRLSGRVLVEPFYEFGKRNWTWFEKSGGNAIQDVKVHRTVGIEGFVLDPIGKYFNISLLEDRILPQGILPFDRFVNSSSTGTQIDILYQFYSDWPAEYNYRCQNLDRKNNESLVNTGSGIMQTYGQTFTIRNWICLFEGDLRQLLLDRDSKVIGIYGYPLYHLGNEWRFHSWEHQSIRSSFKWREDTVMAVARKFIADKFQGEPFIAVHWRRGDWKNRVDASLAIAALWASSNPRPMVAFVREKMMSWNARKVFLATNCGNQDDLSFVKAMLPVVMYEGSGHWSTSTMEAVIEQAICSLADYFVGPPCVSPLHVSSYSRFVLDEREQARKPTDSVDFCCGDGYHAIEIFFYEPEDHHVFTGNVATFHTFSLIMPQGAFMVVRIDGHESHKCEVGKFLCEFIFVLPQKGSYKAVANLYLEDGIIHQTQDTRHFTMQ